jgi:hypothetical protein
VSESAPSPNPLAIASLVCGVIALPCACACYGFPFNVLAIGLGIAAVVQGNGDASKAGGKMLAFGGIGLGVLSVLLSVGVLVFTLFVGPAMGLGMDALSDLM